MKEIEHDIYLDENGMAKVDDVWKAFEASGATIAPQVRQKATQRLKALDGVSGETGEVISQLLGAMVGIVDDMSKALYMLEMRDGEETQLKVNLIEPPR